MKAICLLLATFFLVAQCMAEVIYVDIDAKGLNNGGSWPNAYKQLQSAFWSASSGDEIWVAEGTYTPTGTADRTVSFQLINKVNVYGGFDPTSGVVTFAARNWTTYPCILSGDIGVVGNTSDNSYHVFYHPAGLNLNNSAVLDGFTITLGRATGSVDLQTKGPGMYNDGSSPRLVHCTFDDNLASSQGGAVYNTNSANLDFEECVFLGNYGSGSGGAVCNIDSSPTFDSCDFGADFQENDAASGGAIYNENSNPLITDCTFSYNEGADGGAIFNDHSSPIINTCTFEYNSLAGASFNYRGGAIANTNSSSPEITGCEFYMNLSLAAAFSKGGAIYYDSTSGGHVSSTRFERNISHKDGGAIYCDGASPAFDDNCVFYDNSAGANGGAVYCTNSAAPSLIFCTLEENGAGEQGGAVYCNGSSPTLTRCHIRANGSDWDGGAIAYLSSSGGTVSDCNLVDNFTTVSGMLGGAIYCAQSSPTIVDSDLSRNETSVGGAIACQVNCNPVITNCTMMNNTAEHDGGALFFMDTCSPELTNCIIADNTVNGTSPGYGEGGAAYIWNCPSVTFINCTISNNTADASRGGIYSLNPTVLTNCIVWGNSGTQLSGGLTVTYSDIEGDYTGAGNLNVNPLFVNAAGGDYHLQETSDCVDAGLNSAVPVGITTDIDGDDRIIDGDGNATATVDMGADETPQAIMTVWVDDDYTAGGGNDGHTWGVDAFAIIQDGIDAVYSTGTVNVAGGTYIENLTFTNNIKILGAGAYQTIVDGNNSGSVVHANGISAAGKIDGFTFTHGSGYVGGGLYLNSSDLTISNCIITENTATYGGGMEIDLNSSPIIINCLLANNTAAYGGAMDNYNGCSPTIYNCTFCYNTATSGNGGALHNETNCFPIVKNSILWANSDSEIYDLDVCTTTVNNSDVQGGWTGSNNLNVDPVFLDPADGNYRLDPESLCIDAGLNYAIFIAYNEDLDGNPRLAAKLCNVNSVVDMGCYEFNRQRIGDYNDDCSINIDDLLILSGGWLTDDPLTDIAPPYRNGKVDLADFATFSNYWLLDF